MKHKRQMFFSLLMVLSLLFSSFGAIHVYADDAIPSPQSTEESMIEDDGSETPSEMQDTEEASEIPIDKPNETTENKGNETTPETTQSSSNPTEASTLVTGDEATAEATIEPQAIEEETPEPTEDTQVQHEPTETADPTEEPTVEPTPIRSDEELDTLPEILEKVPEGTEIVVLNENGEPESLVSEKAAETLIEGDPVWCPTGHTPGDAECTASYATFAELLAALQADGGTNYAGEGTIYVADSYNGNDDSAIVIDGNNFSQFHSNNLTIQGGWDDGTGNEGTAGISVFDVSLTINNWLGNITLKNLEFSHVTNTGGYALNVDTQGSATLDKVEVHLSLDDTSGAQISGDAGITIQNVSSFGRNDGNGLIARSSGGDINLSAFSAIRNELTGVYLDTCNWDAATQTCTGSGDVFLNGVSTSNNFQNGILIDAGGSSEIKTLLASNNSLSGLILTSGTQSSDDTILVSGGTFEENAGGSGLNITQYGEGEVYLNSFGASNNQSGIIINSFGSGDVIFSGLSANENAQTGLHAEANGDIKVSGFRFGDNEKYGAYLLSNGDIFIENGTFDYNANDETSEFAGIYAKAVGDISLQNITSELSYDGGGAYLKSTGTGNIDISNSIFQNNATYGINAETNNGNITLNSVIVSTNDTDGSILKVLGNGNISILANSTFSQNANHELYASVESGYINLDNFTVNSNSTSGSKVELINNGSGDVTVTNSTFDELSNSGLSIVANGIVTLNNSFFNNNTNHGVEVYSSYTVSQCHCPENEVSHVTVNVNGGEFGGNGQYGIYVKSDNENSLTLSGSENFLTNGAGSYYVDTSNIPLCLNCGCSNEGSSEEKPADNLDENSYQIVEVPSNGSGNVPQNCSAYAGTFLQMEDGVLVKVACPFEGFSNLKRISENDLPGELGSKLDIAVLLDLLGQDGAIILNSDGSITVTFTIPENSRGRAHQLLFWDASMNDGAGGWIELPPYEVGGSSMLHPENQDDPRLIVSGVVNDGNTMSITVNFGGYFAMIAN